MRYRDISWIVAGLMLALGGGNAYAAPQILAALPSEGGILFVCTDGGCNAALSTYCLQKNRPTPAYNTVYAPAAPQSFTLVLTDALGAERRLPADGLVTFVESRGFMSVSARILESDLARLGAAEARIVVAANATLLPVPVAGDPDPLTEQEIALATGPLRKLGTHLVDRTPTAAAAGMVSGIAGRLPASNSGAAKPDYRGIWKTVAGERAGRPAAVRARSELDFCLQRAGALSPVSVRRCLEWRHDRLIRDLNVDYWNSQAGS